jgi:hypothetical protein
LKAMMLLGRIQKLDMTIDLEEETPRGAWCIVAQISGDGQGVDSGTRGARTFEPGAKVYCFPPNRGGAYESVKVIGPHRKTGKLTAAVVPVQELANWKAEPVTEAQVLEQISPPWDSSDVSKGVAQGIAAWKSGGQWPVAELRQWNRKYAATHVGAGSLVSRLRSAVSRLLGRDED